MASIRPAHQILRTNLKQFKSRGWISNCSASPASVSRRWASSSSSSSAAKSSDMPWMVLSGALTFGAVTYLMRSPKADNKAKEVVAEHVRQEDFVPPKDKESKDDKQEVEKEGKPDEKGTSSEEKGGKDGKQEAPDAGRPEEKGASNPDYGSDDIKESGKENHKEPKERRGDSFEKDNSNQANKVATGAKSPREVEHSTNKGDIKER